MIWDDSLWKLYMTLSLWSYSMYQYLPGSYENADTSRDIYQLIESRGFKYQSHPVVTKDGYILNLIRIINPYIKGTKRRQLKPILLQHGFQCTSTLWVIAANGTLDKYGNYIEYIEDSNENKVKIINGTRQIGNTLGYVLATRGYDVWLANYRGSIYSMNHTKLNPNETEYWKFSMDEMIHYDLPAEIDYILKVTKRKRLSYIGHSQGNLMMLALMSISDRYARKIHPFIALSPVFYNLNLSPAINVVSLPLKTILRAYPTMVPYSNTTRSLIAHVCQNVYIRKFCFEITYPFFGSFTHNMILNRIPVYLSSVPSGSSSWNAAHFMQIISKNGQPKYFDLGRTDNIKCYGQSEPPIYNATNINSTKIAFIYTQNDWLNSMESIQYLKSKLKVKLLDDYLVPDKSYNHLDLIWAKNVGYMVNRRVLKILSSV